MFLAEATGNPQGGVLILHDNQQHGHWPDIVAPLREYLPQHGWSTLSIELPDTPAEQLNFVITGNDRPGIIQELAGVLRHKGANITHLNSKQQSAPNWGLPIFSAVATVALPSGMNKDEVVAALEAITSDLIVDIEDA